MANGNRGVLPKFPDIRLREVKIKQYWESKYCHVGWGVTMVTTAEVFMKTLLYLVNAHYYEPMLLTSVRAIIHLEIIYDSILTQ